MEIDQDIWRVWASYLQRWGVEEWVASILETTGPLTIIGAQVVYIGKPLLGHALPEGHLSALARVLEDPSSTQDFVHYLREATAGGPV